MGKALIRRGSMDTRVCLTVCFTMKKSSGPFTGRRTKIGIGIGIETERTKKTTETITRIETLIGIEKEIETETETETTVTVTVTVTQTGIEKEIETETETIVTERRIETRRESRQGLAVARAADTRSLSTNLVEPQAHHCDLAVSHSKTIRDLSTCRLLVFVAGGVNKARG